MIKANISNNEIVHTGDFGINIAIDHPISDLSITDFIFMRLLGNGITNIELPNSLEIVYTKDPVQTLCMIPVGFPDNVSGVFRVNMRDRSYTLDNVKLGILPQVIGGTDTELHRILCQEKVFQYNIRG